MSAPPNVESMTKNKSPLDFVDMIFIHETLIPNDFEDWLDRVENKVIENRLNKQIPKIVVIGDKKKGLTPKKCIHTKTHGYISMPVDLRQVLFSCASGVKTIFSRYRLDNIGWANISAPVFTARKADLEGLSEFGSSITLSQPLNPGAILFLHGSIFENAPEKHMCARFYYSEPHPEQKGLFKCYFLYFGITDAFLKFTRNYIREKYASEKEKNT